MIEIPVHSFTEIMIIVGGNIFLAVVGALIARKSLKKQKLLHDHQIAGYILAVVGTLYALLLGLLTGNVQSKFETAVASAQAEANSCSDIWNLSRGLPQQIRHQIRANIKSFYIIEQRESWEAIASGKDHEAGDIPYTRIWQSLFDYQPQNDRQTSCYQSCLAAMQDLSDARSYRLALIKRGLAPYVWPVIIVGGVFIVVFTYLFAVESGTTQIVLTVFVTTFISLNLLLVNTFEHPYRKMLHVQSGAFSFKPEVFDDEAAGDPQKSNASLNSSLMFTQNQEK